MAHLLGAEALHLEYPTQVVFDSVTVGVNDGARIGIVGRNGDGKSSLLGMLTGSSRPTAGRVTRRGGLRVAALDQADTLDPAATVGHALVGDLADHEWAGDPRVRDVVAGLVADIDWHAPVATLSGGQRRRVQLAAAADRRLGRDRASTSPPTTSTSRASPGWPGTSRQRWAAHHRRPAGRDPRSVVPRRGR